MYIIQRMLTFFPNCLGEESPITPNLWYVDVIEIYVIYKFFTLGLLGLDNNSLTGVYTKYM